MKNDKGFTLVELMAVIGIIAILTMVTGPPIIKWIAGGKVRSAVMNFKGDMELVKLSAIRYNQNAILEHDSNNYTGFLDLDKDGVRDTGERLIVFRKFPSGVTIGVSDFTGNKVIFNGRGRLEGAAGRIQIDSGAGSRFIGVSFVGRIQIEKE